MQYERTGLISSAFAGLAACIGHPLGGDALGGGAGRAACIGHPLGGLEAAIVWGGAAALWSENWIAATR